MSLVLPSCREVAGGPTVGIKGGQATSMAAAASVANPAVACAAVPVYLRVVKGDEWRVPGNKEEEVGRINGFGLGGRRGGRMMSAEEEEEGVEKEAESSESSSIGAGEESSLSLSSSDRGDGEEEEEEEEVQSKLNVDKDAFGSLNSLEESLPIKRGLSNCFTGKSKSFASLSDAVALGSARDLAKLENPFNKRRRLLMACKASWQRRASYAALNTSTHLWALEEDQEYDEDDATGRRELLHGGGGGGGAGGGGDHDNGGAGETQYSPASMGMRKHIKAFKTTQPRSFSLTDLQHA